MLTKCHIYNNSTHLSPQSHPPFLFSVKHTLAFHRWWHYCFTKIIFNVDMSAGRLKRWRKELMNIDAGFDFKILLGGRGKKDSSAIAVKQITAKKCCVLYVCLGLWSFWVFRVSNVILKFTQEHWGFPCFFCLIELAVVSNFESPV